MAQFRSKPFGVTKNGDKVDEYIISNPGGLEVSVLNYGCVIKNLFVPTKTGLVDVVVGPTSWKPTMAKITCTAPSPAKFTM